MICLVRAVGVGIPLMGRLVADHADLMVMLAGGFGYPPVFIKYIDHAL